MHHIFFFFWGGGGGGDCDFADLDLRPRFLEYHVSSISPTLFEVGLPNVLCGCILGLLYVVYHFCVTVTLLILTFDIISRIIVCGAYLLHYLRQESQIRCVGASLDDKVTSTIVGSL